MHLYLVYLTLNIIFCVPVLPDHWCGLHFGLSFSLLCCAHRSRTLQHLFNVETFITLFRAIIMFCQTDNIIWNIPHIQSGCGEYSAKYCQSRRTMLRLRIMLCSCDVQDIAFHDLTWVWDLCYVVYYGLPKRQCSCPIVKISKDDKHSWDF